MFAEPPSDVSTSPLDELLHRIASLQAINQTLYRDAQVSVHRAERELADVIHHLEKTFSTVQALITQSDCPDNIGEASRSSFAARLRALGQSHALLGPGCMHGAQLHQLIKRCTQPLVDRLDQLTIQGPKVYIQERDVLPLGLAFHELTTNAARFGALSVPQGAVQVTWRLEARRFDQPHSVAILWQERGGPRVASPVRRGFGSQLLTRGLPRVSGGTAQLDFAEHGVECRLWVPLKAVEAVNGVLECP